MSTIICLICDQEISHSDEICVLQQRGVEGFNKCSKERGLNLVAENGTQLHMKCRKRFTDKKDIERYVSFNDFKKRFLNFNYY